MQSGWRCGSLFGIPLYIHPSWLLILALVAVSRGLLWHTRFPAWGAPVAYGSGVLMALLVFASVLVHELGHSLMARRQGLTVDSISLFLFAGVTTIEQESRTPGRALQVAIAGPALSGLLIVLFGLLTLATPGTTHPIGIVMGNLALFNLLLVTINLLPGLPLDGGLILKAIVWRATGSRITGIRWAAKAGKIIGWLLLALGLVLIFWGGVGGAWIGLLGWFIAQSAGTHDRAAVLQETLLKIQVAAAMTREYRVVDVNLTLRQFTNEYLRQITRPPAFFATSEGRYRGMVAIEDLHHIERSEWETETLQRIVQPLQEIPTVEESMPLVEAIQQLEQQGLRRITVLSPAGAVAGMLDRGDIVRALAKKMNLPVSEKFIQQIKEDGEYPPGLPLASFAQAALEAGR